MNILLTLLLVLLFVGAISVAPVANPLVQEWGWGPSGGLFLIAVVLAVILYSGRL